MLMELQIQESQTKIDDKLYKNFTPTYKEADQKGFFGVLADKDGKFIGKSHQKAWSLLYQKDERGVKNQEV